MSRRTYIYVAIVSIVGLVLGLWASTSEIPQQAQWVTFAILLGLAIITELYRTEGRSITHSALPVLEFAALLLLPPSLFVLLVAVALFFTWARTRYHDKLGLHEWYKLPFNISMTIISGFAGLWWARTFLSTELDPAVTTTTMGFLIASAALVMVTVNHLILGGVLTLARNLPPRSIFRRDPQVVLTDFALLLLGYILAILWVINPWFMLLSLSPLYLIYRALWIPQLEQAAQTDDKTGLLRAQQFMTRAAVEFARARRMEQPLSVLMADLDLLRDVNNNYGHLAGDAVLMGVGKVIRETLRHRDVAGRFGGEEFAIVLPNTSLAEARVTACRLCKAVEVACFEVETSETPINVTMSVGVASFPHGASSLAQLLHEADVAVYYAKDQGRNRVVASPDVPDHFRQARSSNNENG